MVVALSNNSSKFNCILIIYTDIVELKLIHKHGTCVRRGVRVVELNTFMQYFDTQRNFFTQKLEKNI